MVIVAGPGGCTTAWHNILGTVILTFWKVWHTPLAIIKPWGNEKLSVFKNVFCIENAFPFPVGYLKRTEKVLCVFTMKIPKVAGKGPSVSQTKGI